MIAIVFAFSVMGLYSVIYGAVLNGLLPDDAITTPDVKPEE